MIPAAVAAPSSRRSRSARAAQDPPQMAQRSRFPTKPAHGFLAKPVPTRGVSVPSGRRGWFGAVSAAAIPESECDAAVAHALTSKSELESITARAIELAALTPAEEAR